MLEEEQKAVEEPKEVEGDKARGPVSNGWTFGGGNGQ
jgi:hypothetical protein